MKQSNPKGASRASSSSKKNVQRISVPPYKPPGNDSNSKPPIVPVTAVALAGIDESGSDGENFLVKQMLG